MLQNACGVKKIIKPRYSISSGYFSERKTETNTMGLFSSWFDTTAKKNNAEFKKKRSNFDHFLDFYPGNPRIIAQFCLKASFMRI